MAVTIPIIFEDAVAVRVVNAVAANNNYKDQIPDPNWVNPEDGTVQPMIQNPETKVQFYKRMVKRWSRSQVRERIQNEEEVAKRIKIRNRGDEINGIE